MRQKNDTRGVRDARQSRGNAELDHEDWGRTDESDEAARARCEALFLANLPRIERLIAQVARQYRLSPDDAEEFVSRVLFRLIDNDYAVLRKFKGQCKLITFLRVVFQRLCLDFRAAQ